MLAIFAGFATPPSAIAQGPAAAPSLRLMVIGDSLTAGFGLPVEQAFPAKLEAALRQKGHAVTVLHAQNRRLLWIALTTGVIAVIALVAALVR